MPSKYKREDDSDLEQPLFAVESDPTQETDSLRSILSGSQAARHRRQESRAYSLLTFFFCVSILINLILSWKINKLDKNSAQAPGYAHLSNNIITPLKPFSLYGLGDTNETRRSILWESLNTSPGTIALPYEVAENLGLPRAQPYPWDTTRGLYLLAGFHDLHCLRKVRRWSTIAYHSGTQVDTYKHVVHCLDQLLQGVLCHADDLPAVTLATPRGDAGYGQTRLCRSWEQLEQWANKYSACYRFTNETQDVSSTLERYKWCPRGNKDASKVRDYFNVTGDELDVVPAEIDSMPEYWKEFDTEKAAWSNTWT